jgi:two-component system response regulator VicR
MTLWGKANLRQRKSDCGVLYCEHPAAAREFSRGLVEIIVSAQNPVINPAPRQAVKVLHIEDDPSVARSLARVLRQRGFEVTSAATHDEVTRYLEVEGFRPDLILTDFQLGLGFTAEIIVAEIAARLHFKPPTIMVTAMAAHGLGNARSFADRIMAKPVDIHLLLSEIDELLGTRQSTDLQN